MITSFSLTLNNLEGALERVLGVVRLRGFRVIGLHAASARGQADLQLDLVLEGSRSPGLLGRQLNRLYEVRSLQLEPARQAVGGPS